MINILVYVQEIIQARSYLEASNQKARAEPPGPAISKDEGKEKKYIQIIMVSITSIVIQPKHKQLKKRYQ